MNKFVLKVFSKQISDLIVLSFNKPNLLSLDALTLPNYWIIFLNHSTFSPSAFSSFLQCIGIPKYLIGKSAELQSNSLVYWNVVSTAAPKQNNLTLIKDYFETLLQNMLVIPIPNPMLSRLLQDAKHILRSIGIELKTSCLTPCFLTTHLHNICDYTWDALLLN